MAQKIASWTESRGDRNPSGKGGVVPSPRGSWHTAVVTVAVLGDATEAGKPDDHPACPECEASWGAEPAGLPFPGSTRGGTAGTVPSPA